MISERIHIQRGIHLGYSLSALLFALVIEPLVEAIWQNIQISGISFNKHFELSLYADNMVVYISSPEKSISAQLGMLQTFTRVSGLSVNPKKVDLFPINISQTVRQKLKKKFKFNWIQREWRHLGVMVLLDLKNLLQANFH